MDTLLYGHFLWPLQCLYQGSFTVHQNKGKDHLGTGWEGRRVSVETLVLKRYKQISCNLKEVLYYKVAKKKHFVLNRGIVRTDWGVDQLLNPLSCQTSC